MEFKDRIEKRKVNETMASLLVPMMNHLDEETQECVRLTIRMLNEQTVENEVKEGSDTVNREVWRKIDKEIEKLGKEGVVKHSGYMVSTGDVSSIIRDCLFGGEQE